MVCEHIGYYGSCMDGFTINDVLLYGITALIIVLAIRIIIRKCRKDGLTAQEKKI